MLQYNYRRQCRQAPVVRHHKNCNGSTEVKLQTVRDTCRQFSLQTIIKVSCRTQLVMTLQQLDDRVKGCTLLCLVKALKRKNCTGCQKLSTKLRLATMMHNTAIQIPGKQRCNARMQPAVPVQLHLTREDNQADPNDLLKGPTLPSRGNCFNSNARNTVAHSGSDHALITAAIGHLCALKVRSNSLPVV